MAAFEIEPASKYGGYSNDSSKCLGKSCERFVPKSEASIGYARSVADDSELPGGGSAISKDYIKRIDARG